MTPISPAPNAPRLSVSSRGGYEVWYLTFNHRASGTGFWIRYTLLAPEKEPASAALWFSHFDRRDPSRNFGLSRAFPIASARIGGEGIVAIGDAALADGRARGAIAHAGHAAEWEIAFEGAGPLHLHLPPWAYDGGFAPTKVLSPCLDGSFRGRVVADGREFLLDGDPGCQSHIWGTRHARAWAWCHAGAFDGAPGVVLEAVVAKGRRFGLPLPTMVFVGVREPGRVDLLSGLPSALRGRWRRTGARRGEIAAVGRDIRVRAEVTWRTEDLIQAEYHDPDGEPAWCHNTEVADCDLAIERREGGAWRRAAYASRGLAHFEWGARSPDPAVKRRVETLRA